LPFDSPTTRESERRPDPTFFPTGSITKSAFGWACHNSRLYNARSCGSPPRDLQRVIDTNLPFLTFLRAFYVQQIEDRTGL
jgi:hypothetical protein